MSMVKSEKRKIAHILKAITVLEKDLIKGFNKPCKTQDIQCSNCQAHRLLTYLEWYGDLLKWK